MGIVQNNLTTVLKEKPTDKVINQNWSIGNGLKFNGISHYSDLGNILNFDYNSALSISSIFTVQDFTLLQAGTNRWILWKGIYGFSAYGYFIDNTQIAFVFEYSPAVYLVYRHLFSPTINTIYHITFTKNTSQIGYFYINGIQYLAEVISGGSMSSIITSNSFLLCEARDGSGLMQAYFKATFYDLKIFDKELSYVEATSLFNTKNNLVPASCINNLQLDLRFEDKQSTIIKDRSINSFSVITNHTLVQTTLGVLNYWLDKYGNPITTL